MLNRAARYYPILRVLRKYNVQPTDRLLEVGSGPFGIGEYRHAPFVGCDVGFDATPLPFMTALCASAIALPFRDRTFPAVIVSDVMEHLPPELRQESVSEVLRVTQTVAVFAFPAGSGAQQLDRDLYAYYQKRGKPIPTWLEEHMQHPFPDAAVFANVPAAWKCASFGNESEKFHMLMVKLESYRLLSMGLKAATILLPSVCEHLLRMADRAPFYRRIFVFERRS